jgi:hypothetical protein
VIEVKIRLFGFGAKASELQTRFKSFPKGTTPVEVWETLRANAQAGSVLAEIDNRKIFCLVNGQPFPQNKIWKVSLSQNDSVTFMILAEGG